MWCNGSSSRKFFAVPGVAQARSSAARCASGRLKSIRQARRGRLVLDDVLATARRATALIGGGYLETPTKRIVIPSHAPGATLDALAQAVVGTRGGLAVRWAMSPACAKEPSRASVILDRR